jgi:hypothetical protein
VALRILWLTGFLMAASWRPPALSAQCPNLKHREFDFWLGTWRVETPDGAVAGTNRIDSILGGCVVFEDWTGASGYRGRSFTIYDAPARRWHQTWVDAQGLLLQLDGGMRDGAMILEGRRLAPDGAEVMHQITWTPNADGTIRQLWRRSRDGGTRWEAVFDGLYHRM